VTHVDNSDYLQPPEEPSDLLIDEYLDWLGIVNRPVTDSSAEDWMAQRGLTNAEKDVIYDYLNETTSYEGEEDA